MKFKQKYPNVKINNIEDSKIKAFKLFEKAKEMHQYWMKVREQIQNL